MCLIAAPNECDTCTMNNLTTNISIHAHFRWSLWSNEAHTQCASKTALEKIGSTKLSYLFWNNQCYTCIVCLCTGYNGTNTAPHQSSLPGSYHLKFELISNNMSTGRQNKTQHDASRISSTESHHCLSELTLALHSTSSSHSAFVTTSKTKRVQ